MNRTNTALSSLAVVLLLTLAGCDGEATFQARLEGGGMDSFPEFTTELHGTDPLRLVTCSKDPTPQIFDDERTLCLHIHLDAARLSEAGGSAKLSIVGEAQLAEAEGILPSEAIFTPGEGHSPVVVTAWATVSCFAQRVPGPFIQQLQGRLELEENTSQQLAGRVVLTSEGRLAVADCGEVNLADFDFRFDVAR